MKLKQPNPAFLKEISKLRVNTRTGRVFDASGELGVRTGRRIHVAVRAKGKRRFFKRYHIVWFARTGRWPRLELNHIDEDTSNDRFTNLVELTHADNCLHSKRSKLPIGVDKQGTRYRARYSRAGVLVYVGCAGSIKEAIKLRREAMR